MKRELEDKIYKDFPLLYRGRNKSLQENLMGFGFECSDGWYYLLYDLSSKLEHLIKKMRPTICKSCYHKKKEHLPVCIHDIPTVELGIANGKDGRCGCSKFTPYYPEVIQVKSKFAGLRYYIHGATNDMNQLIQEAEEESYTICELCGSPGREHQVRSWYWTLCKKCFLLQERRG